MRARHRSWWQTLKRHSFISTGMIIVLIALIAFIFAAYRFGWSGTGFLNKTLWDWLQLLGVLAIPVVVGFGVALFTRTQQLREQEAIDKRAQIDREAAEKRAQIDQDIAQDNQREVTLQAYIDKMSELLLKENLQDSGSEAEVREIARTRTLTALRGLDSNRKGALLQFLHEAGLIQVQKTIIDLSLGGDFSDPLVANLSGANLYGADLRKAYLKKTNLHMADLRGADLSEANLWGADLRMANLEPLDPLSANSPPTGLLATQLNSADLAMAYLTRANLKGAILSDANLSGADLSGADLSSATLYEANLSGANLSGASLGEAGLNGANLSGASLGEAGLNGANLSGAYLKDADVTIEQLDKAKSLQGTTMPDGSIHP